MCTSVICLLARQAAKLFRHLELRPVECIYEGCMRRGPGFGGGGGVGVAAVCRAQVRSARVGCAVCWTCTASAAASHCSVRGNVLCWLELSISHLCSPCTFVLTYYAQCLHPKWHYFIIRHWFFRIQNSISPVIYLAYKVEFFIPMEFGQSV